MARIAYGLLAIPLTLLIVLGGVESAEYLLSVNALPPTAKANVAGPLDPMWPMNVCVVVAAAFSVAGIWLSFVRRAWFTGLLFISISLIPPIMLGMTMQDVMPASHHPSLNVQDATHLVLDGQKIRLDGIAVPKEPPRARCWAEAALGLEAREAVEEFILGRYARRWKVVLLGRAGSDGFAPARLIGDEGDDLAEELQARQFAVRRADAMWDWCGPGHAADLWDQQAGTRPTLSHGAG